MDVLLSIGEFSKMTYLSVKALRHYHDVGLLAPMAIDPVTGYRRYASSQVQTAQVIRRFRDLDMPIDDVRQVLAATDPADRNRVIIQHLERMRQQLERTQWSVASLQALLEEEPRGRTDIELRRMPATTALVARQVVGFDACGDWLEPALADLHTELETAGLDRRLVPTAPSIRDEFFEAGEGEVTAYVPVRRHTVATRSSCPRRPSPCSSTTARSPTSIRPTGPSGTIVAERGIGAPGPIREHYLTADQHRGVLARSRSERPDDHRDAHPRIASPSTASTPSSSARLLVSRCSYRPLPADAASRLRPARRRAERGAFSPSQSRRRRRTGSTSTSTSTSSPRRSSASSTSVPPASASTDEQGYRWITLADPEGNEFDAVERTAARDRLATVPRRVRSSGGGAVAVGGDHEGVEHREHLGRAKRRGSCCEILVPPSTLARAMRHSELSGYRAVGTVRHTSSYGSAETISHTRPHRNTPARLRPRNRAPGTGDAAPPSHSAPTHSWLHSRRG